MGETNPVTRLPLVGISVLITRPLHQAERTAKAIEAAGGEAIIFPTIAIQPLEDDRVLHDVADRISEYDIAIFISANAVEQGLPYLLARRRIPPGLTFAAVGAATKRALMERGVESVLAPVERYDSEALLALPLMGEVAGKRIVIFRGEGGREVLADALRERGASVDYIPCYRRVRPGQDVGLLRNRWRSGSIHAVSALSWESLRNLFDMLDEELRSLLVDTPVLVPHPRIAEAAQKLGLAEVRVTGAEDNALIESLTLCRKP